MNQEHYAAAAMILLFIAAVSAELLPVLPFGCIALIAVCVFKGQLWECKEKEPADKADRLITKNK